jgi:hypothetical protein
MAQTTASGITIRWGDVQKVAYPGKGIAALRASILLCHEPTVGD